MNSYPVFIGKNEFLGGFSNRNKTLFVSLAGYFYKTFLKKQIRNFEVKQLTYPKPTTVQGFQHCPVSLSLGVAQIYGFNQLIDFSSGKCVREFPAQFWGFD